MATNLTDIPTERQCGAKTRDGDPCKNWSMPNGRCRMHGGKSWSGIASPRYRHGFYSKDILCRVIWDAVRRGDPMARPFVEHLLEMAQDGA